MTVMAKQNSEVSTPASATIDINTLAEAIVKAGQANNAPRKITVGERRGKGPIKTAFNPTGRKFKLDGAYFQNGAPISERRISPDEADAMMKLVQGRYGPPDFPVIVEIRKSIAGQKTVKITYPEQSQTDRMKFSRLYGDFRSFCLKLAQEAKAQLQQRKQEARDFLKDEAE